MNEAQFHPKPYSENITMGKVSWQAPSNIALVKYWGKYGEQLPKNASVSFTLKNCNTVTTVSFQKKTTEAYDFQVFLDGNHETSFEPKIAKFFERIDEYVPFISSYAFRIETSNSFPHSSGIASSASGMSALALCLMSIEKQLDPQMSETYFVQKASFLARLGSGSASRSIEGELIVWGKHEKIVGSSNFYGIKYPIEVHPIFQKYQDTILLVDKGEKEVSSTVGHNLMHDHPFAEQRFQQANKNLTKLIPVFEHGDLAEFIKIVESEALSLHAMMMTSHPYFILMKPATLTIINHIWKFRKETNSNLCFTLDAGANVHVLYPENEKELVSEFIKKDLSQFCKNGEYITDELGSGASEL